MFNINSIFIFIILSLLLSLFIDVIYGELPVSIHPVVMVGNIIDFFKGYLIKYRNRLSGVVLYISVMTTSLLILYVVIYACEINDMLFFIVFSLILSQTFSVKLLISSAQEIEGKLNQDIDEARRAVSYLVSRNTEKLSESFITSATIETLSENITDSYISPILYYMIFAIVIVVTNRSLFIPLLFVPAIYRISNTMDAMVGYENDKLRFIGYFPAKVDDVLNFLPSRIAGLFIVLSAYILKMDYKNSYLMYRRDARNCPSPNSGFTMATVAGALDIQLVKKSTYKLGDPIREIDSTDISKAVKLSELSITLFTLSIIIIFVIVYMVI